MPAELYEFGDVTVHLRRVEVRRAGAVVALEPKAFDVLRHLLENRDRLVTKDELLDVVWNGHVRDPERPDAGRRPAAKGARRRRVRGAVHRDGGQAGLSVHRTRQGRRGLPRPRRRPPRRRGDSRPRATPTTLRPSHPMAAPSPTGPFGRGRRRSWSRAWPRAAASSRSRATAAATSSRPSRPTGSGWPTTPASAGASGSCRRPAARRDRSPISARSPPGRPTARPSCSRPARAA